MTGDDGNDALYGGAGVDTLIGGADVLIYSENGMTRVSNVSLATLDISDFMFQLSSDEKYLKILKMKFCQFLMNKFAK